MRAVFMVPIRLLSSRQSVGTQLTYVWVPNILGTLGLAPWEWGVADPLKYMLQPYRHHITEPKIG